MVSHLIPGIGLNFPTDSFLSSIVFSSAMKRFFLTLALIVLYYLLHWIPTGRVVTLIIRLWMIEIANPLTTMVALTLVWDFRAIENSYVMSSSYPFSSSKNPNHWCLLKMSNIGGWRWIILVSVRSLLLNTPPISFLCFQLGEVGMLPVGSL